MIDVLCNCIKPRTLLFVLILLILQLKFLLMNDRVAPMVCCLPIIAVRFHIEETGFMLLLNQMLPAIKDEPSWVTYI